MEQHAAELTEPQRETALAATVCEHLALADRLADRYAGRGEPRDDLRQVARLGLVLAVHRYDPSTGVPFRTYATPTILGELRRHFRDHTWAVRPPRALQELRPRVLHAREELAQRLGRTPRPIELADEVGLSLGLVIEALTLGTAYRPDPMDGPLAETLVAPDHRLSEVEDTLVLRPALQDLPERSRTVLALRYVEDLAQGDIAHRIGLSQAQVSRILSRALAAVRSRVAPRP